MYPKCGNQSTVAFILSSDQVKRFKMEIDNLIYLEIIHQIPSASLPLEIMDTYKGFYIDSGKYLHTLQSIGVRLDSSNIYDFNYTRPSPIISNITDYMINLDDVEHEFVECPNCGSRVSKAHPVYIAAKLCTNCAYKFE